MVELILQIAVREAQIMKHIKYVKMFRRLFNTKLLLNRAKKTIAMKKYLPRVTPSEISMASNGVNAMTKIVNQYVIFWRRLISHNILSTND